MISEYKSKLTLIKEARKSAYRLTPLFFILIGGGLVAEYFLPNAGAIFGIAAFIVVYQRWTAVAHLPCPRCGEPFGTASKFPLGLGVDHCQSCKLPLNDQQEKQDNYKH